MSSNNDKNKNPIEHRIKGQTEEQAILLTFIKVVRSKFFVTPSSPTENGYENNHGGYNTIQEKHQSRIARIEEMYNQPGIYDAEKKLLTDMNSNGLMRGLLAGVGTFFILRRGPIMLHRYMMKKNTTTTSTPNAFPVNNNNMKGGYTFDLPKNTIPPPNTNVPPYQKGGLLFRSFKLFIDTTFSITIAMYGTFFFTDYTKLVQDAKSIPLVSGKSIVSDELCTDFIDVYRSVPKRTMERVSVESKPVKAIGDFVKNCLRREIVEKELLEEKKRFGSFEIMDSDVSRDDTTTTRTTEMDYDWNKHPSIPSPGVSPDIPVTIQWRDTSEEVTVAKDKIDDDDSFYGFDSKSDVDNGDFQDSSFPDYSDKKNGK